MAETTQAKRYRLTERMQIHGGIYPAGSIIELLPNEVTAQMQEVGATEHLAASLAGVVCVGAASREAGFITLDQPRNPRSAVRLDAARKLWVSSTADLSGVNLMIFGVNEAGEPIDEKLRGPSPVAGAEDVVTANEYRTVTGLAASGAVSGLTIDAMETAEEIAARVAFEDARDRALYLKIGRTPDEDAAVERMLARRAALTAQEKRTAREEDELKRLDAALLPVEDPKPETPGAPGPARHPLTSAAGARRAAAPAPMVPAYAHRDASDALAPLTPAEVKRLAELRAMPNNRTPDQEAETSALAAREHIVHANANLTAEETTRLVELRAMTGRDAVQDVEMAGLAARA